VRKSRLGNRAARRGAALALLACAIGAVFPANARSAGSKVPARMTAIDGSTVDITAMTSVSTVVVVTLKSTGCPVCQTQLARLAARDVMLRACGAQFVVLGPGSREQLAEIRERSGFAYPFVADSDLKIASALGLRMSDTEAVPAILVLDADRSVAWALRGRSAGAYGDDALLEKLDCSEKLRV
jgi:peroxiredoxin